MIIPRTGEWTSLQKITPVIVGLAVLALVGLIWLLYRYRRRKSSRRAQGANRFPGHHRNESAASYSSTSYLNTMNPSQLPLPVHRIRFFFSGMFPVRERRRNSDWNIEGEPGLPRRSSVAYDPPSHRESDSFFTSTPSVHARNDTPPTSPTTTRSPRSPFQAISRWWASANLAKSRDYQAVHLVSARKSSKLGTDDDNHPEPEFIPPPPQNQGSNIGNGRTSGEEIPPAVTTSNGEGQSAPRLQTLQPGTQPPNSKRLPSLRPNRPGNIVAVENPSPTQQLQSADVS